MESDRYPAHEPVVVNHVVAQEMGYTPTNSIPISPVDFGPPAQVPPNQDLLREHPSVGSDEPVPVVKVLSVRGIEYLFMSICLWFSAGALIGVILAPLNGQTSMDSLAFPLSLILVSLPGFAFFFLRLKRAELAQPSLRLDASKRRLSQITQVLAFLTCLINIITFVYIVLQKIGGSSSISIGKTIVNVLVILAIAGGILAYYWHDEHRRIR